MAEINVSTESETDSKYVLDASVAEEGSTLSFKVTLDKEDYDSLSKGRTPENLIKESFQFLLERESKEMILRKFNVKVISQYFPEFKKEITS
jgi:hypothetical protein